MKQVTGYLRQKGPAGIRNYTLVISTVHCANSLAQSIADKTGSHVIVHDYGCLESADNARSTFFALKNVALNPNIAAVLIVGLGCEQTDRDRLLSEIRNVEKPVECLTLQACGGFIKAEELGIKLMNEMKAHISDKRESISFSNLVVGVQCGGSDWTTALAANPLIGALTDRIVKAGGSVLMGECAGFPGSEHIVAEHACSYEVGLQIMDMCDSLRAVFFSEHGQSLSDVNPTPGNKAGGITTLVEKSMGNVKKMGAAPIQGILRIGEYPPHPGLWLLDIRAAGPDATTTSGFSLSGAVMGVFSTGRGTPLGNVAFPVVKLTGNTDAYRMLPDILDFNAGVILEGQSLDTTADALFDFVLDIACGCCSRSEINHCFEFMIPRDYR